MIEEYPRKHLQDKGTKQYKLQSFYLPVVLSKMKHEWPNGNIIKVNELINRLRPLY